MDQEDAVAPLGTSQQISRGLTAQLKPISRRHPAFFLLSPTCRVLVFRTCQLSWSTSCQSAFSFQPDGPPIGLQYDELDLRLVTGSADGTLKSWDLRNGECQRAFGGRQGDPPVPAGAVRAAGVSCTSAPSVFTFPPLQPSRRSSRDFSCRVLQSSTRSSGPRECGSRSQTRLV
jgi:WD40 repeat protein